MLERSRGGRIAAAKCRDHLGRIAHLDAMAPGTIREARTGEPSLHAANAPAVTGRPWQLVGQERRRQRIVPPQRTDECPFAFSVAQCACAAPWQLAAELWHIFL